jgi:hypothetical protein
LNPSQPQLISTYIHIRSCDPVVVNDTTAFVTLRADNNCRIGGGANQLEVINIKNKSTPILVNTVPLIAPKGLGLVGSRLFVCDTNGLLLFDVSDWNNIELVKIYSGFIGNDVIPMGDIMLLTSDSGIFILNIENTEDVKQIAKIQ